MLSSIIGAQVSIGTINSGLASLVLLAIAVFGQADSKPFLPDYDSASDFRETLSWIRSKKQTCQMLDHHYARYGQWAGRSNRTHVVPVLIIPSKIAVRSVLLDELRLPDDRTSLILSGATDCPAELQLSLGDTDSIMTTALCPFYWKTNYDPLRIPAVLPQAVCRCSRAVTPSNDVAYECKEVPMDMRVLKFDPDCNQYVEETITISFGCVSTHRPFNVLVKTVGIEQHATENFEAET